jgi:hypothetical protein
MSDDFGMVNRGKHRAGEEYGDDADDERRKSPAPRQHQNDEGYDWDYGGPGKSE